MHPDYILVKCLLIILFAYSTECVPSCILLLRDGSKWHQASHPDATYYLHIQSVQEENLNEVLKLTPKNDTGTNVLLQVYSLLRRPNIARVALRKGGGSVVCADDVPTLENSIPTYSRLVTKQKRLEDYTDLSMVFNKRVRRKAEQNDFSGFLAIPDGTRSTRAETPRPYVPEKTRGRNENFFGFLDPYPTAEEQSLGPSRGAGEVSVNIPFFRPETPTQPQQPMPPKESNKIQSIVECGRREPSYDIASRIFGGEELERGSWPWLVAIFHGGLPDTTLLCGGTLVSSKAVITAAHCFVSRSDLEFVFVALGRHDIRNLVEEGSLVLQARVNIHPHFRSQMQDSSFDADLAVLQLVQEVSFNEFIKPACLWPPTIFTSDIINRTGMVAGWGEIDNNAFLSTPRQAMAPVVSNEVCFSRNPTLMSVTTARNFCAGKLDGSGPCKGDSGGGLLFNEGGRWTLRGVVSVIPNKMLVGCDHDSSYVVYTDVAQFRTWIDELIY